LRVYVATYSCLDTFVIILIIGMQPYANCLECKVAIYRFGAINR